MLSISAQASLTSRLHTYRMPEGLYILIFFSFCAKNSLHRPEVFGGQMYALLPQPLLAKNRGSIISAIIGTNANWPVQGRISYKITSAGSYDSTAGAAD